MASRKKTDPERHEESFAKSGKICRFCKRVNPFDTNVCLYCGQRPLTWRSEFRVMLWLIVVLALGTIFFYAWQSENPPPSSGRETSRSRH